MLKNNIELDVKTRCIEKGVTQADLAEAAGITPSYVNRIIRKNRHIPHSRIKSFIVDIYHAVF